MFNAKLYRKISKNLVLLLSFSLIFFLASCSRLSVAVRWADTFIVQAVDSKFDLNSEQKREFSSEVKKAIASVRKDKFPIWAEHFEKWANTIQKSGATEKLSFEMWDYVFAEVRELTKLAESPAFKLMDVISEKNIEFYHKTSLKEIAEARKKSQLTEGDKYLKEQKGKILPWIEYWHDNLTKNQEQKLDEFLMQSPFPIELSLKHREAQLEKFFLLKNDKPAQKKWIREFFLTPELARSKDYHAKLIEWQQKLRIWIRDFHQSLSEKQCGYFANELRKRAAELRELAATTD